MNENETYTLTGTSPVFTQIHPTHTEPTAFVPVDEQELLSGSVEVIKDSTNILLNESTGLILGRVPIALCVILMVIIGIFKVI